MNTGARLAGLDEAQQRVLDVQRKLHEWASDDADGFPTRDLVWTVRPTDAG